MKILSLLISELKTVFKNIMTGGKGNDDDHFNTPFAIS